MVGYIEMFRDGHRKENLKRQEVSEGKRKNKRVFSGQIM